MVLNHTTQSLTLRRVPPNLLVSQGALQFAREMGVPELPHDALVSPAAKERWVRWHADLKLAERKAKKNGLHPSCWKIREPEDEVEQERSRHRHTNKMLQIYPQLSSSRSSDTSRCCTVDDDLSTSPSNTSGPSSDVSMTTSPAAPASFDPEVVPARPASIEESSRSAFINSTQRVPTLNQVREPYVGQLQMSRIAEDGLMADVGRTGFHARRSWGDGSEEESDSTSSAATAKAPEDAEAGTKFTAYEKPSVLYTSPRDSLSAKTAEITTLTPTASIPLHNCLDQEEDHITDTVGAIAVDGWGNIACAASSGGIGMKYRGRVGPAALVGVGTAVVPKEPDDPDETCVATVTSGTGEHMATTMAATVCAERLYQSVKKQKGGEYAEVTEDEALRSMIENEFMGKLVLCQIMFSFNLPTGHPSVKNSNSAGAIGILGVKKTRQGVMLYYGHNTDSFAMASMHSDEKAPWCTMSRNNGYGQIAQGGRMMSYQKKKKSKVTPTSRQPLV